jgi:hypothetical protein
MKDEHNEKQPAQHPGSEHHHDKVDDFTSAEV